MTQPPKRGNRQKPKREAKGVLKGRRYVRAEVLAPVSWTHSTLSGWLQMTGGCLQDQTNLVADCLPTSPSGQPKARRATKVQFSAQLSSNRKKKSDIAKGDFHAPVSIIMGLVAKRTAHLGYGHESIKAMPSTLHS